MTKGLLFSSAIKQYQAQKEAAEKQDALNLFIDEHKTIVEQTKKADRSKEGQFMLREMIKNSLAKNDIEMEKSQQVKDAATKDIGSRHP